MFHRPKIKKSTLTLLFTIFLELSIAFFVLSQPILVRTSGQGWRSREHEEYFDDYKSYSEIKEVKKYEDMSLEERATMFWKTNGVTSLSMNPTLPRQEEENVMDLISQGLSSATSTQPKQEFSEPKPTFFPTSPTYQIVPFISMVSLFSFIPTICSVVAMMNKRWKKSKYEKILLALLVLISFVSISFHAGRITASLGEANIRNVGAVTYEGSFTKVASYIVWNSGPTIYATDGLNGSLYYSGMDASTVIQNAINALGKTGGKIFIKEGTYIISNTLLITRSNIQIFGVGDGTILKLGNNLNEDIIEIGASTIEVQIWNIKLDGNKDNNISGSGIMFKGEAWQHKLFNVKIINCAEYGIRTTTGGVGSGINWGYIFFNVRTDYCNLDGTRLGSASDFTMINLIASNNGKHGIVIDGPGTFFHLHAWSNGESGIVVTATASTTRLFYPASEHNGKHGIVIGATGAGVTECFISGGLVTDNGVSIPNTYHGIVIADSQNVKIVGSYIRNKDAPNQRYGIAETGTSDYNVFLYNTFKDNVVGAVYIVGVHTKAKYNVGFVTENGGVATFPDGASSFAFAHGLAGSAIIVNIGWKANISGRNWWWSSNSTHITIYLSAASDGAWDFSWHAEYRP